jgi:hypothetical protein
MTGALGVQDETVTESLCAPDGTVAEIGLVTRAELILDMGDSRQIVDHAGIDYYFYEFAEKTGILLDPTELAVAPDNGTGQPGQFVDVFIWGDNDQSNNGTIPPEYRPEIPRRSIETSDLHNGSGIGIDIGLGDGQRFRFIRIRTHPPSAVRPPGKRTQVDAIEIKE